jgi:8-oxo-dGTP pyrophosphatase MutT (NUDIX family)
MTAGEHFSTGLPTKRMAADCLFVDTTGAILIVQPTYKDAWEIPGGIVEQDESPLQAARREVREEIGLDIEPGSLLAVDWLPRRGDFTEVVAFLFDGGVLEPDAISRIDLQQEELRDVRFLTLDAAEPLLDGAILRRLRAALAAPGSVSTPYLEDGRPVRLINS